MLLLGCVLVASPAYNIPIDCSAVIPDSEVKRILQIKSSTDTTIIPVSVENTIDGNMLPTILGNIW